MSSLFRNSRSVITRYLYIRRNVTTGGTSTSGTQPKTTGATTNFSHATKPGDGGNLAIRDAGRRTSPTDPIRPKPVGNSHL